LISGQSERALCKSFNITAANPPVGSYGDKWEIASIAEIDNMLPRRIEDLRRFTGRQQLIIPRFVNASLSYMLSHSCQHTDQTQKTQYTTLFGVFCV
jgi:hypothetical protein